MRTLSKILLAAFMLPAISCTKENSSNQLPGNNDESLKQVVSADEANEYISIKSASHIVMLKNLNVTHYRNGDNIPQVKSAVGWKTLTMGAWCWYNNDSVNGRIYGKLYNWYAVNDPRGLAPAGWHIPSDSEWTTLTTRLGGDVLAGGKMKSTGTIEAGTGLWYAPNTGATNTSGFTGLPGGYRSGGNGAFASISYGGYWWSSTEDFTDLAVYRYLFYFESQIYGGGGSDKRNGFSIRCFKD